MHFKKGFSLIEMLIAVGILAVIAVSVNTFLFSGLRNARKATAVSSVRSEGAFALQSLLSMVRYGSEITLCSPTQITLRRFQELPISDVTYQLSSGRIASISGTRTIYLTSPDFTITGCGSGIFTCGSDLRSVGVCFDISKNASIDVTDSGASRLEGRTVVRRFGD